MQELLAGILSTLLEGRESRRGVTMLESSVKLDTKEDVDRQDKDGMYKEQL